MAFTLSGTTITQSGTDTSLAGLLGIAGVTTEIVGGVTAYKIAGHQFVVTGNLTYDAKIQRIEMAGATASPVFRVNSGGVLTINSLVNGRPTYDEAVIVRAATSAVQTEFQISQGATFNLNGGKIVTSGIGSTRFQTYFFNKGATINITDGWIKTYANGSRWGESESGTLANFNINRLIVQMNIFNIFGVFGNLTGLSPLNTIIQLVSLGAFSSLSIRDFNPIDGTGSRIGNWDVQNGLVYNPTSSNIVLMNGGNSAGINRWLSVIKEITVTTRNTSNANIAGASVYIRDTNNGARQDVVNIPNQLNDNVYVYSTNSSGITSTIPVYILHGRCVAAAEVVRDYRTKTTVAGQDLFDIHTWAYGFQYRGLSNTALRGNGILALTSEMLTETNVTLTEVNAIAKLASSFYVNTATNTITVTNASTLDDSYDVMKVYKTRPIQAQLEYPTISTQPVTANGDTLVTAMSVVGLEFLTAGTKFKKLQANGTANGTMSNLTVNGNVTQATPTNLSNVVITGTLTYNTNSNVTITITNTTINTVVNNGTGIITINRENSTIANYTDAEINFIDSTIAVIGADTVTFHPTATDRDLNINASGSFTSSFAFKFGSVVNGSTMSGTLYLRCVAGGIPFDINKTIVLGDNLVDLGTTAQLASLSAKIDLTAKEATLLQTEADIINAIGSGGGGHGGGGGGLTLAQIEASTVLAKESTSQSIITKVDAIQTSVNDIDVDFTPVLDAVATKPTLSEMEASSVLANKTDITTAQTSIETKIDAIPETDLTGIATTTDVTTAKDNILTAINDIPETDLTLVAKESTVQKIKQNTDLITATL